MELDDYKTWEQSILDELEKEEKAKEACKDTCSDKQFDEILKKLNIIIDLMADIRQLLVVTAASKEAIQELNKPSISDIYK
jgi:hypothetical protein